MCWGTRAIESYKTKEAGTTSLMKEISSYRILSNLEQKSTFKTAINFPVNHDKRFCDFSS